MVAPEFSATKEEVLDLVVPVQTYEYSVAEGIDLMEVVRSVAARAIAVNSALDELAAEEGVDRAALGQTRRLNWYTVYELARDRNVELMLVMKEALAWLREQDKPRTGSKKQQSRASVLFQQDMERMKKFKGVPDGRSIREEAASKKRQDKKDKKLAELRGNREGKDAAKGWFR